MNWTLNHVQKTEAEAKPTGKPLLGYRRVKERERKGELKREGQGGRKEGSAGRRHEKLEQELRALRRAGEMTVEIRTGAKRSKQKGTAGTKKFKAGRNYREKWTEKKQAEFQ